MMTAGSGSRAGPGRGPGYVGPGDTRSAARIGNATAGRHRPGALAKLPATPRPRPSRRNLDRPYRRPWCAVHGAGRRGCRRPRQRRRGTGCRGLRRRPARGLAHRSSRSARNGLLEALGRGGGLAPRHAARASRAGSPSIPGRRPPSNRTSGGRTSDRRRWIDPNVRSSVTSTIVMAGSADARSRVYGACCRAASGDGGYSAVQHVLERSRANEPCGEGTRRVPTADRHLDDAYAVLGVDRLADDETIATAHRRLARRHHPDLAGESATRRMMRINAAFDAIGTAAARSGEGHAQATSCATTLVGPGRGGAGRAVSWISAGISAGRWARSGGGSRLPVWLGDRGRALSRRDRPAAGADGIPPQPHARRFGPPGALVSAASTSVAGGLPMPAASPGARRPRTPSISGRLALESAQAQCSGRCRLGIHTCSNGSRATRTSSWVSRVMPTTRPSPVPIAAWRGAIIDVAGETANAR